MMDGSLPMALLAAALGLALAFAPGRAGWLGVLGMAIAALIVGQITMAAALRPVAFAGLWISLAATALLVHAPRLLRGAGAALVGLNAGLWIGSVAATAAPRDAAGLGLALLPAALALPVGRWLVDRGWGIAVKVAASWLLAVGLLAGLVSQTPTPGFAPDHMD